MSGAQLPAWVAHDIAGHMDAISAHFKDDMKITLLARSVLNDGGQRDLVMTEDDLSAVIDALENIRRENAS